MSRGLDHDPRTESSESTRAPGHGAAPSARPIAAPDLGRSRSTGSGGAQTSDDAAEPLSRALHPSGRSVHPTALDTALARDVDRDRDIRWRNHTIPLSASQAATLRTLGTFRTVAVSDLARHRFVGNQARCLRELRQLQRRGWIEARTLPGRRGGRAVTVATLTRDGHALVRAHLARDGERLHLGLVRPKEQAHDAALYRMAVIETERLAARGLTVTRVVLDAELKGSLAAVRNRPGIDDPEVRTRAAAQALHLQVVDGRVQIPDLRLEYETRDGDVGRVDLELATEHYRPDQVAAKARAGMTIYAPASQTGRLAAALQDRGLVATLLSL